VGLWLSFTAPTAWWTWESGYFCAVTAALHMTMMSMEGHYCWSTRPGWACVGIQARPTRRIEQTPHTVTTIYSADIENSDRNALKKIPINLILTT
jgi:hypothetical protein